MVKSWKSCLIGKFVNAFYSYAFVSFDYFQFSFYKITVLFLSVRLFKEKKIFFLIKYEPLSYLYLWSPENQIILKFSGDNHEILKKEEEYNFRELVH